MKILVVSGFLGAGKTTLIEDIVKKTTDDIVILENEYGEIGIDGDVLKQDEMNIWEMTEGCICCSMKANFAASVLTIANTVDPDILIIEPTGVGMLSAIMDNIAKVQYERISVLAPVTIVDPECIETYMNEYREIFEDQIKNAGKVIISKVQESDKESVIKAKKTINELNNDAQIWDMPYGDISDKEWHTILSTKWNGDTSKGNDNVDIEVDNISFSGIEFDSLQRFEAYMNAIMSGRFGDVIRAKGFLKINDVWSKFDIVGKKYVLKKIRKMEQSKIILLGNHLNKEELSILFNEKTV